MADTLLGDGTATQTDDPQTQTQTEPQTQTEVSNATTNIFGEYANDPTIQKFKSPEDLAKSYIELQKLVGKKKIPVPEKPEEYNEVFKQLGLPESPDKYPDFEEAPQIFGSNEDWQAFKEIAHEVGLLPQQFEKLYGVVKNMMAAESQETLQMREQMVQQAMQQLSQEWGEEFQNKLALAQKLFRTMPPELQQHISEAGLDVNPEFVKILSKLAENYKEDSFMISDYTPAEAKNELQSIMNNKDHPYWNKEHPEHQAAVEKIQKLYEVIYGNRG